jgi:trehalose/maltose hydrolase-like predicted phosphorylase
MTRLSFAVIFCWAAAVVAAATSKIPVEWQRQIDAYDAFYSENDDGKINSEGYPGIYLPLMGNGYFSHSKGVRSDTYFVAGVYNNETTSPSIRARIPATFAVQVENSATTGALLDLRNGTYYRRGDLTSYPGSSYELRWYAHMSRRNIYVMELQVFTRSEVSLKLTNDAGAPSDAINFHQKESAGYLLQCGNTTIPETPDSATTTVCMVSTKLPKALTFTAKDNGKTTTFITAVRTSLDSAEPEAHVMADFASAVQVQSATSLAAAKQTPLQQEHIAAWADLWTSGIELEGGRPDACIAVNASLYAILSSVRDDWEYGLAPGGLTNYYSGHSFWDTETWMYPSLLLMRPSTARSLVAYRFNRLDGAYKKAKTYSPPYEGAMFPWESAFTGVETCPSWAPTGEREQHISADISLAVWQYFSVTQDMEWLRTVGYPILKGVADFFVSRVTMETTADGTTVAHIYDVIPPDEYVEHANDSVYTNFGAASALRSAVSAAALLGETVPTTYTTVADALVVLFDATLNIHPEYQGYPGNTIKQADVVLLHYPWNMEMSDEVRRSDLEYYSTRSDPNGPAMTWGMHMIGYKDLQMLPEAAQFFNRSFQDNTHSPFNVWSETPQGNAGNFITGAGGFLQTLTHGYAGIRIKDAELQMTYPVCPEGTSQLKIRNVGYLGSALAVSYSCYAADSTTCPSVANTLNIEVKTAGKTPLQLVAYDPVTGAVSATYALAAGKTTSVAVPCVAGSVPKFSIQAAM